MLVVVVSERNKKGLTCVGARRWKEVWASMEMLVVSPWKCYLLGKVVDVLHQSGSHSKNCRFDAFFP